MNQSNKEQNEHFVNTEIKKKNQNRKYRNKRSI